MRSVHIPIKTASHSASAMTKPTLDDSFFIACISILFLHQWSGHSIQGPAIAGKLISLITTERVPYKKQKSPNADASGFFVLWTVSSITSNFGPAATRCCTSSTPNRYRRGWSRFSSDFRVVPPYSLTAHPEDAETCHRGTQKHQEAGCVIPRRFSIIVTRVRM